MSPSVQHKGASPRAAGEGEEKGVHSPSAHELHIRLVTSAAGVRAGSLPGGVHTDRDAFVYSVHFRIHRGCREVNGRHERPMRCNALHTAPMGTPSPTMSQLHRMAHLC